MFNSLVKYLFNPNQIMDAVLAEAPGKLILLGEHAVVANRAAIALAGSVLKFKFRNLKTLF